MVIMSLSPSPISDIQPGEDQGDAHYLYENLTTFPFLRANNKAVSAGGRAGGRQRGSSGWGLKMPAWGLERVPTHTRSSCTPTNLPFSQSDLPSHLTFGGV